MAPVTDFRTWPDLVTRGWGVMRHDGTRHLFVPQLDAMTTVPGITGQIHQLVAPSVDHLLRWLEARRGRPLDKTGCWGLAVRPIRGREAAAYAGDVDAWSNHAAGVAFDVEAPRNPLGAPGRGDFPPGWRDECHRLGFAWGAAAPAGDYLGRPDRMHIEFVGTPAQAREYLALLPGRRPIPPDRPDPVREDDAMITLIPLAPDPSGRCRATVMAEGAAASQVVDQAWITLGSTWGDARFVVTALDGAGGVLDAQQLDVANNRAATYVVPAACRLATLEVTSRPGVVPAAALVVRTR